MTKKRTAISFQQSARKIFGRGLAIINGENEREKDNDQWKRLVGAVGLLVVLGAAAIADAQTPEADPETTPITLEDNRIQFNFAYPADWVSAEQESPFLALQLANDQDILDSNLLSGSEPPIIAAGQVAAYVFLADQRNFPETGELANDASVADTAAFAAEGFQSILQEVEACIFQIEDHPAAQISGHFGEEEGFDFLMILVDMGMGSQYREFGQVIALSALGEMPAYAPTVLDIAASMEVLEDGEARRLEEAEILSDLPECESEPQATPEPNDQ